MRSIVSRVLLVALVGVAVAAAIRLGSGSGDGLVAFDDIGPRSLHHAAIALEAPGRLAVDAAGSYEEQTSAASDTTMAAYGWIVRRDDGAVVWRMRPPRPSRGTLVSVRDTLALDAGVYDVYFTSYGDPLVRDPGPRDGSLGERIRAALSRGGRAWHGDASRWRLRLSEPPGAPSVATTDVDPRDPAEAAAPGDSSRIWIARGVSDRQRRERLFRVTAPVEVRVRATTEVTDGAVRDVPTIARLGAADTLWTFQPEGAAWAGGALKNRQRTDVVALDPGLYRVAFETDRSHAYDDWEANPPDVPWSWGMDLTAVGDPNAVVAIDPDAIDLPRLAGFDCVGSDVERERLFALAAPTDVLVVAAGEIIRGSRYDYGGLDRLDGDDWDEVWEMSQGNTEAAGGDRKNRRGVVALSLEPATYRLRYETDDSHDCGDGYNSTPPDGDLWGAVVYALDPDIDMGTVSYPDERAAEAARPPSPFRAGGRAPLVRIDSVGNSEERVASLVLTQPTDLRVVAVGELAPDARYDYAEILDADGGVVWEMTWANTEPAGGSSLNRRFDGGLRLPAGAYTVRYQTDNRHAFGSLEPDAPDDPTFWGVHVYDDRPPPPARDADAVEIEV